MHSLVPPNLSVEIEMATGHYKEKAGGHVYDHQGNKFLRDKRESKWSFCDDLWRSSDRNASLFQRSRKTLTKINKQKKQL